MVAGDDITGELAQRIPLPIPFFFYQRSLLNLGQQLVNGNAPLAACLLDRPAAASAKIDLIFLEHAYGPGILRRQGAQSFSGCRSHCIPPMPRLSPLLPRKL